MDLNQNDVKKAGRARFRRFRLRAAVALAALACSLLLRLSVLSNEAALKAVLTPYARAVELFFGYDVRWESGRGYVIAETRAILTEDCSGLGWFALAFPLLVFLFFPAALAASFDRDLLFRYAMKVFCVSAAAAFSSNLIRILASQAFGPIKRGLGLAFYSAHGAEGMLIFLGAFLACVVALKRSEKHERERS